MVEPLPGEEASDDRGRVPSEPPSDAPAGARDVGVARHLTSLLIAISFVPAAYVLLDYASTRAATRVALVEGSLPTEIYVTMGVAAGCLFLVAAAGRISGFGPLVGGILWGVLPTLWVYGDFSSYADAVGDLPEAYDDIGFGLLSSGFAIYPAVAGLLLGTALAGRWRRRAAESF